MNLSNGVKAVLALSFVSFMIVFLANACGDGLPGGGGNDDDDDDNATTPTPTPNLSDDNPPSMVGNWGACTSDDEGDPARETHSFTDTAVTFSHESFGNAADCSGDPMFIFQFTGTYQVGTFVKVIVSDAALIDEAVLNGIWELDITFNAGTLVLLTADAVNHFNSNSLCGRSSWAIDEQVDIGTLTCADLGFPPLPYTEYTIYKLVDNEFTLGDTDANPDLDGTSAEKRIEELSELEHSATTAVTLPVGDDDDDDVVTGPPMNGTWQKCEENDGDYDETTVVFGSNFTRQIFTYDGAACTGNIQLKVTTTGTYTKGVANAAVPGAWLLDMVATGGNIIADTPAQVLAFNNATMCGKGDWVEGELVSLSDVNCPGISLPQTSYSLYKIAGTTMFLGKEGEGGNDGSNEPKRHSTLEVVPFDKL